MGPVFPTIAHFEFLLWHCKLNKTTVAHICMHGTNAYKWHALKCTKLALGLKLLSGA